MWKDIKVDTRDQNEEGEEKESEDEKDERELELEEEKRDGKRAEGAEMREEVLFVCSAFLERREG